MGARELAPSRRQLLLATTAAAGLAALLGRDTFAQAADRSYAKPPKLRANAGKGTSVAVIGAGIAGLTSAYYLAKAGFDVTVLEANERYGGRSLTLRPEAEIYRKYNKERYGIGEDTYADRFQETGGPLQICQFFDDGWDQRPGTYPEELFLNAGPGRIPSFHIAVLDLAREIGVEMEPFIFATRANLLQSNDFNGGQPIQLRRIKHDLRGEISEMLAKLAGDGKLAPYLGNADQRSFLEMIKEFGALKGDPTEDGKYLYYAGTNRAGYAVLPGAGQRKGKLHPHVGLEEILASQFWNKEIFHDMRSYWQTSLLQPKGGMDMLWQRLLKQPVSADGKRRLQDLVKLGSPVTAIANIADGKKVRVEWSGLRPGSRSFDYCISTMAPNLLARVSNNTSRHKS
jgi:monoamine oxidase